MEEQRVTPLAERKVVRRGLLAGLAGLGAAAMLKFSGNATAEAASGDALVLGNLNTFPGIPGSNPSVPPGQVFEHGTRINYTTGTNTVTALDVRHSTMAINQNLAGGHAIQGSNNNSQPAIFGRNHLSGPGIGGTSVTGPGVLGLASVQGVRGIGTFNGVGVIGMSNTGSSSSPDANGNGIGVQGKSTGGPGVQGESVSSLGVRGLSHDFVGVVGISDNNHGLYGATGNPNAAGLVGENLSGGIAGFFQGNVQIYGSLQVFGAPKNAVLKMQDGTFASVYCQESPEPYFEDFGRAQLVGGVANVPLEREFATLVAGGDYHVFTHPQGDTKGLYVSRQGPSGFEVRECQGGTGSIAFSYRIVTRRKDIEGKRFARVSTEAAEKVAGARAVLAAMGTPGSTSGPGASPFSPLPSQQPVPPVTDPSPVGPGGPGSVVPGAGASTAPGGPSGGR